MAGRQLRLGGSSPVSPTDCRARIATTSRIAPLIDWPAIIDARRRNWNAVASELRVGLAAVKTLTLPVRLGSFADMRAHAHDVPLGDVSVPIAHRDDLLRMKRASGRPQDLADVRLLESLGDEP